MECKLIQAVIEGKLEREYVLKMSFIYIIHFPVTANLCESQVTMIGCKTSVPWNIQGKISIYKKYRIQNNDRTTCFGMS